MADTLKTSILEAMHQYLQRKGYSDFYSTIDSMDNPKIKVSYNEDQFILPDMTARKDGKEYIFEVELGNRIASGDFLTKCRAIYKAANKRGARLYLVVPVETFDKTLQIINRNNLENIGILQINMNAN